MKKCSGKYFYKNINKFFRREGNYSTLPSHHENSCMQFLKEWVWLCSNKTLFIKADNKWIWPTGCSCQPLSPDLLVLQMRRLRLYVLPVVRVKGTWCKLCLWFPTALRRVVLDECVWKIKCPRFCDEMPATRTPCIWRFSFKQLETGKFLTWYF